MRKTMTAAAMAISLFSCLQPSNVQAAGGEQKQSLHRVDFRVEGASCVTCLRRVAAGLRQTKGVLKADVSIYKPYWAIVIYDAKATNFQKVSAIAKVEKVRFAAVEDKGIAEMPVIIIPKITPPPAARTAAGSSSH